MTDTELLAEIQSLYTILSDEHERRYKAAKDLVKDSDVQARQQDIIFQLGRLRSAVADLKIALA